MSEDITLDEGALVAGLGAYLRAAPVHDLPAKLRRLRSFTPAGLRKHQVQLLTLLDEAASRALVAEWLEKGRPAVNKAHKDALAAACRAGDGWRDLVARPDPGVPPEDGGGAERVDHEQAKAEKARLQARRAKQEAREAVARERSRADGLAAEVAALRDRASEQDATLISVRAELDEARDRLERDQRRWERKLQRAEGERDSARDDASALRRELRELRQEVRRLQRDLERAETASRSPRRPKPAAPQPPRRRRPLPAPKGRLEDDPETLAEWLDVAEVHLLVDGYNVTLAEGGFAGLELEDQRARLVQSLDALARRKGFAATVVFDGAEVAPATGRRRGGRVRVAYSKPDEIADDHLIALLDALPTFPVVVATNDQELQERGRALGATIATSNQLLALLR